MADIIVKQAVPKSVKLMYLNKLIKDSNSKLDHAVYQTDTYNLY